MWIFFIPISCLVFLLSVKSCNERDVMIEQLKLKQIEAQFDLQDCGQDTTEASDGRD
jgi:hypothetical protein